MFHLFLLLQNFRSEKCEDKLVVVYNYLYLYTW